MLDGFIRLHKILGLAWIVTHCAGLHPCIVTAFPVNHRMLVSGIPHRTPWPDEDAIHALHGRNPEPSSNA